MGKTTDKQDPIESGEVSSVQNAIALMAESLVAWRQSLSDALTGNSDENLRKFLIIAREGYRQMVIKELHKSRKPRKPSKYTKPSKKDQIDEIISSGGLDQLGTAEDIAQQCMLPLIKRAEQGRQPPFNTAKIDDLLAAAASAGLPQTGAGSPMNGYLYQVLLNGMRSQARLKSMKTTWNYLIRQGTFFLDDGSADLMCGGTQPDNVIRNVSKLQNIALATKVHDDYLDTKTYKGDPLRVVLGSWTPIDEWTGRCSSEDRPNRGDENFQRALQRHMKEIIRLILVTKNKTKSPSFSPDDNLV